MKKLANEYTIESDFSILAGPYSSINPEELRWLQNVVADMKSGNIEYKVSEIEGEYYVQRKGMIVTKRK
jgi:hypothetical protein